MSAAIAAASAAALSNRRPINRSSSSVENIQRYNYHLYHAHSAPEELYRPLATGRYESQKRRDWNHFVQYLKKRHRQPFKLSFCTGADVVEFLHYLNQTKVHASSCPYSDRSQPPPPCSCRLPGSVDALIRRLRVAFEDNGGPPATNPFCSSAVSLYLEGLRSSQAKAEAIEQ